MSIGEPGHSKASSAATLDNENATFKKKKIQFVSQVEGQYYCTYMVKEDGTKILMSKVPVQAGPNTERKNEDTLHSPSTINTQEMMDILQAGAGLQKAMQNRSKLSG